MIMKYTSNEKLDAYNHYAIIESICEDIGNDIQEIINCKNIDVIGLVSGTPEQRAQTLRGPIEGFAKYQGYDAESVVKALLTVNEMLGQRMDEYEKIFDNEKFDSADIDNAIWKTIE